MNPYRESQGVVIWGRALLVLAMAALLVILITPIDRGGNSPWVLWAVFALLALIAVNFWRMKVDIDSEALTVGFGIIKKRIPLSEITNWKPATYSWLKFGGWGIRRARDGSRAYSARGRQGVAIQTQERTYIITTNDPEQLARAISRFMGGKNAP